MLSNLPWPARSVIAGRGRHRDDDARLRGRAPVAPRAPGPLDYDDWLVPGQIVAAVMHLPHVTAREEDELGLALALERRLGVRPLAPHAAPQAAASRGRARRSARR